MSSAFEKLYSIEIFHDCPRTGVANFDGRPHFFEAEWDTEVDDFSANYELSLISNEMLLLVEEAWATWARWQRAYRNGETPHETWPALDEDRVRRDVLRSILDDRLVIKKENVVRAKAEFRYGEDGLDDMEVRWTRI